MHLTIPAEPTSSCSCFHTHIANYLPSSLKHEKTTCSAHWKAICRQKICGSDCLSAAISVVKVDDFSDGIQWKLCPSDSAHFSAAWPKCQKNDTGSHSACLCAVKCRSAGCAPGRSTGTALLTSQSHVFRVSYTWRRRKQTTHFQEICRTRSLYCPSLNSSKTGNCKLPAHNPP